MRYAETNFLNRPVFIGLTQPGFLNFGPQYFHNSSDWTYHFLRPEATKPAGNFFTRR